MRAIASLGCEGVMCAIATTLPTTPTRDAARVKGNCTNRAIFTLPRCTTDELFFSYCYSDVAHFKRAATLQPRRKPTVETCVDNTAKLRPQASVLTLRAAGASQLLKHAPTTPRSYGRRHRSWHHDHVHATHNERRRGKRPVQKPRTLKAATRKLKADEEATIRGAFAVVGLCFCFAPFRPLPRPRRPLPPSTA